MGFRISLTSRIDRIRPVQPALWRGIDGLCAIYWQASAEAGANGYYLSADPRIMLFFEDVSDHIQIADRSAAEDPVWRPMLRALYIPAGQPMHTRFGAAHRFSHLDLHFSRDWLLERLSPLFGTEAAQAALRLPVEKPESPALTATALALVAELKSPAHGPRFTQSLALSLLTGLIDEPPEADHRTGGLTPAQMRQLRRRVAESAGHRLSNAELSAGLGLSEGWFCQAFRRTTGRTPLQWQQEERLALVKECLAGSDLSIAEIALRFGFSDQAHLTRSFRQAEGIPPAAWRRQMIAQ